MRLKAQSVMEYFIIMVVILSVIVGLKMARLDGRMIGAFRSYFNRAVNEMR
jgi:hypothetical protein